MHLGGLRAIRTKTPYNWELRFNPFAPKLRQRGLGPSSLLTSLWWCEEGSARTEACSLGRLPSRICQTLVWIRGYQFMVTSPEPVVVWFRRGEAETSVTLKTKGRSRDIVPGKEEVGDNDLNDWFLWGTGSRHSAWVARGPLVRLRGFLCGMDGNLTVVITMLWATGVKGPKSPSPQVRMASLGLHF